MEEGKKNYWRKDFQVNDYLIIGGGLLTTLAAFALSAYSISKDFAFISWLAWFVIPLGCIFLGAISASGFFIAARIRQQKMSLAGAVLMVVILVPSYFMHYGFVYRHTTFQTDNQVVPAYEAMNFLEFYRFEMTTRVYVSHRAADEEKARAKPVGNWGYLYALIEILGFLTGGVGFLLICAQWAYCDECKRYFLDKRIGVSANSQKAEELLEALQMNNEVGIRSSLAYGWGLNLPRGENLKNGGHFYLSLSFCEGCHENSIFEIKFQSATSSKTTDIGQADISKSLTKEILGV